MFKSTAGFGDVCYEQYGRYPSIETLESKDVRPGNVKNLPVDSGVNPISHDIRQNFTEFRRILVEIDKRLDLILSRDGIEWLMGTLCEGTPGFLFYDGFLFLRLFIFLSTEQV